MSPSRGARTAAVCTLVLGVAIARAQNAEAPPKERRAVAVIDLSDSTTGEQFANALNAALNNHDRLKILDMATLTPVLVGGIVDEDADHLAEGIRGKVTAEEALRRRDF